MEWVKEGRVFGGGGHNIQTQFLDLDPRSYPAVGFMQICTIY